jgi:GGDEF domain-containing protein
VSYNLSKYDLQRSSKVLNIIHHFSKNFSTRKCLIATLAGSILIGILDYLIGPQLSFSIFYTIPIMLAAWYGRKLIGLFVAFISAGIWLSADLAAGSDYTIWLIPIWNTLVRLSFFLIIVSLLLIVREKLTIEESLADTDPLTGLANRRFFLEQLEHEHTRFFRYPESFTIAYIDLDNFKYVNDSLGHDVGDELLCSVAQILSINVRASDFVARLGGDEFAISAALSLRTTGGTSPLNISQIN